MTIHLAPPTSSGGPGDSRSGTKPGPQERAVDAAAVGLPAGQPAVAPRESEGQEPAGQESGPPTAEDRTRGAARSRRAGRVLLAAGLVLAVGAVAAWVGVWRAGAAGTRTVVVTMHHSKFQPAAITVAPGTEVRFVLRNTDPIDHEFIIGGQAVHDLHERGTQRVHDGPGEVTVPAGEERATTVSFNLRAPGRLQYACHLPGHYAYGMRGVVTVTR